VTIVTVWRRAGRPAHLLAPLLLIPGVAAGQEGRLVRGAVLDTAGAPLAEAAVAPVGGGGGGGRAEGGSARGGVPLL